MIDTALIITQWAATLLTAVSVPLAAWLAWKNRWQPEDDGRGGQEWPDVVLPDDPGGLTVPWEDPDAPTVDWDNELIELLEGETCDLTSQH